MESISKYEGHVKLSGTIFPGGGDKALLESNLSTLPAHQGKLYRSSRDDSPCPDGAKAENSGGEALGEGAGPLPNPTSLVSYRHISASDSQKRIYTAFVDAGERSKGDSFSTCGEEVHTLKCESCGYEHKVTYNCKLRFCSSCARGKLSRYMEKYLPYLDSLKPFSVRSVMLSMRNVIDIQAGVDKIRKDFNALRHRKYYKSRIEGGLYGIEAKPALDGKWNIHLHFVYLGSYIPQGKLSDDWLDVTGDSSYVWINRGTRPSDSLRYVLKYITKGIELDDAQWTDEKLVEFVVALENVRLIQAFGCFLGEIAEKKPFLCPDCGYSMWAVLDSEGETMWSPLETMLWNFRNGRSP